MYGEYALEFLGRNGPYLLHSFLYDRFQLTNDFQFDWSHWPSTPSQLEYAEMFRTVRSPRTNHRFSQMDHAEHSFWKPKRHAEKRHRLCGAHACLLHGTLGKCSLVSTDPALQHCNTEGSTFSTLHTNGTTLESHLVDWFFRQNKVPPERLYPFRVSMVFGRCYLVHI